MRHQPGAGKTGAVDVTAQPSMGFVGVVVSHEALDDPAQHRQVRARLAEHAGLPEGVEALHVRIAPRLAGWDEDQMAPQQHMQPHEQGEAIGMPLPARRRHLVIELGDPGNPQAPPRPHTMLTERQSGFVTDGR